MGLDSLSAARASCSKCPPVYLREKSGSRNSLTGQRGDSEPTNVTPECTCQTAEVHPGSQPEKFATIVVRTGPSSRTLLRNGRSEQGAITGTFIASENDIGENGSMWPAHGGDAMGNWRAPMEMPSTRFRDARVSGNNATVAQISFYMLQQPPSTFTSWLQFFSKCCPRRLQWIAFCFAISIN